MSKSNTTSSAAPKSALQVRDYPITTPDGLTYMDPQGKPPEFGPDGRLVSEFLLTEVTGARSLYKAGMRGPLPVTNRAWAIFKEACIVAREKKRTIPKSVNEAVEAWLKANDAVSNVPLPVIPEPERVDMIPVENPPKARKTREAKPLSERTKKGVYDRLWLVAKREGPEALAEFKRAWRAGEIEGSPHQVGAEVKVDASADEPAADAA